ncbi:MAG: CUB domain-containing protein [Bacteroidetes bacterium]|nr:CUB domain-containing protein [Bacteroidota bacterium]
MNIKLLTFFTLFFALLIHLNYAEAQGTYNMCSGTTSTSDTTGTLYDSGGPSGNYSDNETCDFLISGIPGQAIILKFNSYQTRTYNDYMKVYDGTSASDPIIMMGNGENHPDSIVAFSGNVYVTWLTYSTFDLPLSGFDISWYTTSNYQSPATTYCLPAYQSAGPNPNYIEDLWMADLRATTDQGLSQINPFHCAFYNDYSSDTGNTEYDQNSTRLIIGQTQTLHISTAAEPGQTCAAWIDYNNDGDFNDQNEKLGSSMTNKHLAYWNHSHIQFTIPDNVTPGLKRLRVMGSSGNPALRYGVFTDFDACNPPESSVGETEDFSVLIDANYCVPATNNDNTKFIIDSVALNGINHYNIAKPVSGYINTTTQPLSYLMSHGMFSYISPSATYTLSLKLKNVFQSTFINYWVDEDNDGEFEEYETPSHVDSIYLPTLGDTVVSFPFGLYGSGFKRLRIELSNQRISPGYVQESCHDLVYGEVIDYLVYFTSDFSIPSTASASSAGTTITSVRLNSTTYNNPNTADILYDYFDNPSYEFDLQPGKNNEIEIHSTVAGASYLSAFIDYDNDNDYDFDDIFENLRMNSTFGTSTSVYHASSGTYTDKFIFNTHALECAGPVRLHIVIGDTTNEAYLNGSTMLYGQMIDYRVNMANDANLATVADFLPRKTTAFPGRFRLAPAKFTSLIKAMVILIVGRGIFQMVFLQVLTYQTL